MLFRKAFRILTVVALVAAVGLGGVETGSSQTGSMGGTAIWVNSSGDPADNRCGGQFRPGDRIVVFFRVQQRTRSVQIWDFAPSQQQPLLFDERHGVPQRVSAGQVVRALSGTLTSEGTETLVLQAETTSGIVLSAACDLAISESVYFEPYIYAPTEPAFDSPGGATGIVRLGINELDRGCNVLYEAGQSLKLLYWVEGSGTVPVALYNTSRSGSMQVLFRRTISPSTTYRGDIDVPGSAGISTLVLQAGVEGGWINSFCLMHVREESSISEDFETGTRFSLPWQTWASAGDLWDVTSGSRHFGNYAIRAGEIGDGERTLLTLGFSTPRPGTLSFWYRVSSESSYDFLRFYDGEKKLGEWSGEIGWAKANFSLSAGTHILRWKYTKDESQSSGQDTAWIDDFLFRP